MDIQTQIAALDQIAAGAVVPWVARTKALGGRLSNAEEIALHLGATPALASKVKAAIATEATSDQPGLAGSSTAVTAFVKQSSESSVFLRMLTDGAVTAAPMRARLIATAADVTAAEVGEGAPIPMQRLNLANPIILEPARIAAAFVATKELWAATSSEGQAFINGEFRAAVAQAADRYLFDRLTTSGTLVVDAYDDEDNVLSSLRLALDTVNVRAGDRAYYAMSPHAANWLETLPGGNDRLRPMSGQFLDRPCVITDALPDRRIAVVAARALAANVERLEIDTSEHGTIEMSDTPTQDIGTLPVEAQISLFQIGAVATKIQLWLAVEAIRADGLAFVDILETSGS